MYYSAKDLVASLTHEQLKRLFLESFDTDNAMLLGLTFDRIASSRPDSVFKLLAKKFKDVLVIEPGSATSIILSAKLHENKEIHPSFEELSKRLKDVTVDINEFEHILWATKGDSISV
jgi:hypothetical protein